MLGQEVTPQKKKEKEKKSRSSLKVWGQLLEAWLAHFEKLGPGARFSKVPKLYGRSSVDMILFVFSKRRRLVARNSAVILIFIPFTT